VGF
jgi:hypothetical protein